ncbi:NAD(P)H dehydrogenase [Mesorhizobium sp. B2-2-1]|uniref:NAD(P)H dehydrogenase n=1 Tax=Mesorhizobium sp. B2-2-1 TaxID=2589965 RepID=UPI001AED1278
MFIGVASGGVFTGERANQPDFLTPYLTLALNSIGLQSLQFLPLEATAFLDGDKAGLARKKTLAALDLTVVRELPGVGSPAVISRCPAAPESIAKNTLAARRNLLARPCDNLPAAAGL